MKCKLNSHPKILLKTHIDNVYETGITFFERNHIYEDYLDLIKIILVLHDFGKASVFFQQYINKQETNNDLKVHAEFGAFWSLFYCQEIMGFDNVKSLIAFWIIKKHHGNFDNFQLNFKPNLTQEQIFEINRNIDYEEMRYILEPYLKNVEIFTPENFEIFYKKYGNGDIITFLNNYELTDCSDWKDKDLYYLINYLFSILISADKGEAIFKNIVKPNDTNILQDINISTPTSNADDLINNLRVTTSEEVMNKTSNLENKIFSLCAPTGIGKTIVGLKFALELCRNKKLNLNKIIYASPAISITDQTERVLENILRSNNIPLNYKHIMKYDYISESIEEKETENKPTLKTNELNYLYDMWSTEFVVTTDQQVLYTLFSCWNRSLKRLQNLTNSVIIMDEIQSIPHKYWELINQTFIKFAEKYNIYFIIMTATMPIMFNVNKTTNLLKSEPYFKAMHRTVMKFYNQDMTIDKLTDMVSEQSKKEKKQIVVLNTVECANDVYHLMSLKTNKKILLLTANLIPKDRNKIIEQYKHLKKCILISTQVIEAGVDIDSDCLYRDFAPWVSIIQGAGRCNRNGLKPIGEVKIFRLINEHYKAKSNDEPNNKYYFNFIYDEILINATQEILNEILKEQGSEITEQEYFNVSQKYFLALNSKKSDEISIAILKELQELNYAKIFKPPKGTEYPNNRNKKEFLFELIDNRNQKKVYFILDRKAKSLKSKLDKLDIKKFKNPYEYNDERKKIFKQLNQFSISVYPQYLNPKIFDKEQEIIWIDNEKFYNKKTGFVRFKSNF